MSSKTSTPTHGPRSSDEERFDAVKRELLSVGFLRRGSVVERFMTCGKSGCRCMATPPELHGPYYQWTRKVRGKTVTLRLNPEEAKHMTEWIRNGRELDKLVAQLEAIALRITDRLLRDLKREPDKSKP